MDEENDKQYQNNCVYRWTKRMTDQYQNNCVYRWTKRMTDQYQNNCKIIAVE